MSRDLILKKRKVGPVKVMTKIQPVENGKDRKNKDD